MLSARQIRFWGLLHTPAHQVTSLYAIMGVSFFDRDAEQAFGNLSRALVSMFRIAAGETWVLHIISTLPLALSPSRTKTHKHTSKDIP